MCGIFAILNNTFNFDFIHREFMKGQKRGPEFSKLDMNYMNLILGFHRLAINGLNDTSNQPIVVNDIILICNGEIYNYKQLYAEMNVKPTTDSDCEVIIHLYLKYGIEQTLLMLDGVYSFVLYDNRIINILNNRLFVARDSFGVRPLYYLKNTKKNDLLNDYMFASELKCLEKFYNDNVEDYELGQFSPGTYNVFHLSNKVSPKWELVQENIRYHLPTFSYSNESLYSNIDTTFEDIYSNISQYLCNAVNKRCCTTERPIACLLSGGLDSSLIASLITNYYRTAGINTKLETYSIGLKDSEDLKYARIVADWIQSKHTEIIVTEEEFFNVIPEVIGAIESYDTTTVRASIGNYLIGKYISMHSDAKVIFNGDGSDELLGGYLYMNNCPDDIEFDKETRRLLKDIYLFDVLRSDKSISSNGLEPRTPFLDRSFVNYVLSISPYFRNHTNFKFSEKFLLRESFKEGRFKNALEKQILPNEVLLRKKEAFSDGVSSHQRSLYVILQERIAEILNNDISEGSNNIYIANIDTEKYYYKKIFTKLYPNCESILPYFWMPKYIESNDPSARTLSTYNE